MKVDVCEAPKFNDVLIGNVYAAKGPGPTRYWMVAALGQNSCHMLGIDEDGSIVSTATYGQHSMRDRDLIGICHEIAWHVLHVEWRTPK